MRFAGLYTSRPRAPLGDDPTARRCNERDLDRRMHPMPAARGKAIALMATLVTALSVGQALPASAASSPTTSDLQAVITSTGTISTPPDIYHALRVSSSGAWKGFNGLSGYVLGMPNEVNGVAIAGANGELHVLVTNIRGTEANLYHALRTADGRWKGFNNVSGPASVPASMNPYMAVAAAIVNGDLHVLLLTSGPNLYHAIRFASTGAWKGFNPVSSAARVPSGVTFPSIAAASVNGDLQVLVNTNTGLLYHALRSSATGAWNGFNDVSCCASVPSAITAVSIAGT